MIKIIISIYLFIISSSLFAAQTVFVYWPFGPGDFSFVQMRSIFDKANKSQNKYNFVLLSVTGAAGAIAANRAILDGALLAHSSAFFVRPLLFPDTTNYKFDDFQMTAALSITPFAIVSRNDFNLPTDTLAPMSIGVAGLGSTTHVIAESLKKIYPNLLIVPYKTLTEINADVIGGNINLGLDFIRNAEQNKNIKILGITGKRKIKEYRLLTELGAESADLVSDLFILRPKTMPTVQGHELFEILKTAMNNNPELKNLDEINFAMPHKLSTQSQLDAYYQTQQKNWQYFTKNIKVD